MQKFGTLFVKLFKSDHVCFFRLLLQLYSVVERHSASKKVARAIHGLELTLLLLTFTQEMLIVFFVY